MPLRLSREWVFVSLGMREIISKVFADKSHMTLQAVRTHLGLLDKRFQVVAQSVVNTLEERMHQRGIQSEGRATTSAAQNVAETSEDNGRASASC